MVDSSKSIIRALTESCKILDIEPLIPFSKVKIGPPLDKILQSILPSEESSLYDLFKHTFIKLYDRKFCKDCVVYPGALHALSQAAKNADLFLVTNKRISPTINILRHHQILKIFKGILGSDSISNVGLSKSMSISYLIQDFGLDRSQCTYFGDTGADAISCQEAGIDFVFTTWGYGNINEVSDLQVKTMDNWNKLANFAKD